MTEKTLDLLQLAASGAAKPSATSAEVMRRELADPNLTGERLDDMPDQLFRYGFAPSSASAAHAAENAALVSIGSRFPVI